MNKTEINRYLFFEFGVEGEEDQVSDTWPFELRFLDVVDLGDEQINVFHFTEDNDEYFVLDGNALNFQSTEGMSLEDLRALLLGSKWIGRRDPIDLNTTRIGDELVPPTPVRRAAIMEIIEKSFGKDRTVRILEGLLLRGHGQYLALVQDELSSEIFVVGSDITPYPVRLIEGLESRLLSFGVGEMLSKHYL
jgi:hypothetical protein